MRHGIRFTGGVVVHIVFAGVLAVFLSAPSPAPPAPSRSEPLIWTAPQPDAKNGGGEGGNQLKASAARLRREISHDAPRFVLPRIPDMLAALELPGVKVAFAARDATGPGTDSGPPAGQGEGSNGPGSGTHKGPGGGPGDGPFVDGTPGLTSPLLLSEVRPEYTPEAMRARVQGVVLLEATVLETGRVGHVRIVRSVDRTYGLDGKAIEAVRGWRFRPGVYQGRPVAVKVFVELHFTLR